MHRVALPLCGLTLIFFLGLTACKDSGISSPADYKKAVSKFQVSKVKVIQIAKEARQSGDPMVLTRAVERLVPATNQMHGAAHGVLVDDPGLSALHSELLSAVDGYKGVLDGLAPTVSNTPLPKSKIAMHNALEAFNKGVASWETGLKSLP